VTCAKKTALVTSDYFRGYKSSLESAERGRFDSPEIRNLLLNLYLRLKSCSERDLARLEDVLILHGFLPSRDGP